MLFRSQAAICSAHSHQGTENAEHAERSHVHLSGHGHSHDHDSSGHEHRTSDDAASNPNVDTCDPGSHDSGAIYFGDQNDLQVPSKQWTTAISTILTIWSVADWPLIEKPIQRSQVTRTGRFAQLHCALFLQTRCLLI